MTKTVEQRVADVVAQQFMMHGEHVTPEQDIFEDLGGDSLDAIEIVMELENEFDIDISDASVEGVKTVQQLIDLVKPLVDH